MSAASSSSTAGSCNASNSLSAAERAAIAIVRALQDWDDSTKGLLILDEPTASLNRGEVDALFREVRRVASMGVAVLFVSHALDEVLDLADRIKAKPGDYRNAMQRKTLLMIFEKPSLRTRVSFETGVTQMGGWIVRKLSDYSTVSFSGGKQQVQMVFEC